MAASSAECRAGRRVIVQSLENCSLSLGCQRIKFFCCRLYNLIEGSSYSWSSKYKINKKIKGLEIVFII